jgi:hypothetical protein
LTGDRLRRTLARRLALPQHGSDASPGEPCRLRTLTKSLIAAGMRAKRKTFPTYRKSIFQVPKRYLKTVYSQVLKRHLQAQVPKRYLLSIYRVVVGDVGVNLRKVQLLSLPANPSPSDGKSGRHQSLPRYSVASLLSLFPLTDRPLQRLSLRPKVLPSLRGTVQLLGQRRSWTTT